jgi:hypothetical protein
MNILILHRIPYYKIEYHKGIDHFRHKVFYIGTEESLQSIPENIPCEKIIRPGRANVFREVCEYINKLKIKFDHIISLSEYELQTAAQLREVFHVNGSSSADVEIVRNKLLMKKAVFQNRIRVPDFYHLPEFIERNDISATGRWVIKPIDGASSENVIIFKDRSTLKSSLKYRRTGIAELDSGISAIKRYEVEEYVDGEIIHIDGLVLDGNVIACLTSQYIGNCLSYANGNPLGSVQIDTSNDMREWTQSCIDAVKIKKGSFHLEAIKSKQGLVFLEIANRVGGGDVVKTFELAAGIHLPTAELKLIMQENVSLNLNKQSYYKYGWFVFPGHKIESGYARVINAEKFKDHELMREWYQLGNDQLCKKNITYQSNEVPVAGVVQGVDSIDLINFMNKMFVSVKVVGSNNSINKVA